MVSGSNSQRHITGNLGSIHGNAVGIDVNAGSATMTGNHIYNNTTGIRFTNGGNGPVDGNNLTDGDDFTP